MNSELHGVTMLHPTIEARLHRLLPESAVADRAAEVLAVSRPALRLYRGGNAPASSRSWVGGLPALPEGIEWPTWDPTEPLEKSIATIERKIANGVPKMDLAGRVFDLQPSTLRRLQKLRTALFPIPRPLNFVMQLDLADADPAATASVDLPDHGILWLFQDTELIYSRYPQSWRLIYDPAPGPLLERAPPKSLEPFVLWAVSLRPAIDLPFNLGQPLASPEDDGWPVAELQIAINAEVDGAIGIGWLGGCGCDDEWCQPRVYATATLPEGEAAADRWAELVEASKSWRCLLALASDKDRDPRWLWGDVGDLSYWLPEADLRGRRFDNAWLYINTT